MLLWRQPHLYPVIDYASYNSHVIGCVPVRERLGCKDIITGFLYYFFTNRLQAHHRVWRDYRVFLFSAYQVLRTACYHI